MHGPSASNGSFNLLPYQLLMVGYLSTMSTMGNGELRFDSREGAWETDNSVAQLFHNVAMYVAVCIEVLSLMIIAIIVTLLFITADIFIPMYITTVVSKNLHKIAT